MTPGSNGSHPTVELVAAPIHVLVHNDRRYLDAAQLRTWLLESAMRQTDQGAKKILVMAAEAVRKVSQ